MYVCLSINVGFLEMYRRGHGVKNESPCLPLTNHTQFHFPDICEKVSMQI